ncbi:MAG: hypothetical protein V1494_06305 [Candidatus Diapherotrites archaeon]
MANATLTLAIPEKLKKDIRELKEINWSEETRSFLEDRVERLKALRTLDEILKGSRLTEKDIEELGAKIKQGIAKAHERK